MSDYYQFRDEKGTPIDYYQLVNDNNELCEEIERLHSIIKALHKYFEEHEQYEDNEFLRQLESTTKNDKEWLKKMGGK